MEPLKITFRVSGGLVPPAFPMHLDAILAFAETRDSLHYLEEGEVSVVALRELAATLPLARYEQDGEWVWKASAIFPESGRLATTGRIFTQRRDKADYCLRVGAGDVQHGRHAPGVPLSPYQYQIDTLRGVHRNLLGFYSVQGGLDGQLLLVAYCIGNRTAIEEILTSGRITHLGARRRAGHGCIESVQVDVDEAAHEKWKLRVRPWQMLEDDATMQAAWRAPYWAKENQGQAFCPVGLL